MGHRDEEDEDDDAQDSRSGNAKRPPPIVTDLDFTPSYILGGVGPIARKLPHYEVRKQQIQLSEAVRQAFSEKRHLVAEAGTGTGKSYAFLVPAMETAVQTNTPVVISTHTIALQEQLYNKDIPFLLEHLGLNLKVVLAKGRANYVSLRRAAVAERTLAKSSSDVQTQLEQLKTWLGGTSDGTKSSQSFKVLPMLWGRVKSDPDNCHGESCPTFKSCFYQKARSELSEANLIITNHSMVLIDLKMKSEGLKGVLPDYSYLVLDEAHELEEVARQVFTSEISQYDIPGALGEVWNDAGQGFLNTLYMSYAGDSLSSFLESGTPSSKDSQDKKVVLDCVTNIKSLLEENEKFFQKQVVSFLGNKPSRRFRTAGELKTKLYDGIRNTLGALKLLNPILNDKHSKSSLEYSTKKLTEIALVIDKVMTLPKAEGKSYSEVVAWATADIFSKPKKYSITCSPIFLKPILKKVLFTPIKSVIMTSATLATGGNEPFRMFNSAVGVDNPLQVRVSSVFDYNTQAKLYIVSDVPEQSSPDYESKLAEQVKKFVNLTKGGAFVLFTSNKTMQAVYKTTQTAFEMSGYDLFIQGGELSKNKMIEEFKKTRRGVLFGVDSFWTGVDIPGESLRNIIITKLPFPPPDDPLAQAQEEVYKLFKRNFFMERALPGTAIMLKQGFGRLIRQKTDSGIVAILDSRLLTKKYGNFLLSSLPKCPVEKVNMSKPLGVSKAHESFIEQFDESTFNF